MEDFCLEVTKLRDHIKEHTTPLSDPNSSERLVKMDKTFSTFNTKSVFNMKFIAGLLCLFLIAGLVVGNLESGFSTHEQKLKNQLALQNLTETFCDKYVELADLVIDFNLDNFRDISIRVSKVECDESRVNNPLFFDFERSEDSLIVLIQRCGSLIDIFDEDKTKNAFMDMVARKVMKN